MNVLPALMTMAEGADRAYQRTDQGKRPPHAGKQRLWIFNHYAVPPEMTDNTRH